MKYNLVATLIAFIFSLHNLLYAQGKITAIRLIANPIITPAMLTGNDGENINGPSLIKVPAWIKNPLGKYITCTLQITRANIYGWLIQTILKGHGKFIIMEH